MTSDGMPNVRSAIRDARVAQPDERGLMPLAEARALLDGTTRFVKGDGELVDGTYVLESDRVWAALLSLADADEFLGHALRISWEFHVRGRVNLAAYERYGDGILPWLASRVDEDGVLHNVPWCVLPCLLESGSPEAYAIAATVRDVDVLCQWVTRHPEVGFRLLANKPNDAIRVLHAADPHGTQHRLSTAVGPDAAVELLERLGLGVATLPTGMSEALAAAPLIEAGPSEPVAIVELDQSFRDYDCPMWDNANYFCSGMRLVGFVTPGGTDGLVFQSVVTGLGMADVRIEFHRFGFGLKPGADYSVQREILSEDAAEEINGASVSVPVPNGVLEVVPLRMAEFGQLEGVMLALTADKASADATFLTAEQLKSTLDLPAAARELFVLDEWSHPDASQVASDSEDLLFVVEALRHRRAITSALSGKDRAAHLRERVEIIGGWGDSA